MSAVCDSDRRIVVLQGGYDVSDDPHAVFTTILGSCVAACIRDPLARVGGMNHFLLPGEDDGRDAARLYGIHLMELLINGLMKRGAARDRLEAKLFGGARMLDGFSDIGRRNAAFATEFLRHEGVKVVGGDLGGARGRRVHYWPVSGRARQVYVATREHAQAVARTPTTSVGGHVDLF